MFIFHFLALIDDNARARRPNFFRMTEKLIIFYGGYSIPKTPLKK